MYNFNSLEDIMRSPTTEEINESVERLDDNLSFGGYSRKHKKKHNSK